MGSVRTTLADEHGTSPLLRSAAYCTSPLGLCWQGSALEIRGFVVQPAQPLTEGQWVAQVLTGIIWYLMGGLTILPDGGI